MQMGEGVIYKSQKGLRRAKYIRTKCAAFQREKAKKDVKALADEKRHKKPKVRTRDVPSKSANKLHQQREAQNSLISLGLLLLPPAFFF